MTESDWQERVKGLLKAELKRRGISYKQLAEKLEELGVHENDRNIANKLARGGFSAVFLIQCFEAIGCNTVQLRVTSKSSLQQQNHVKRTKRVQNSLKLYTASVS